MLERGIILDEKHSFYDFNAILESGKVDQPKEIKITERVPYSNTVYDFSYGYNDQKFYEERKLSFIFHIHNES